MQPRLIWSSLCALALLGATALAQNNFSSGSTGADGAFAPTQNQTIVVPASGVFNFTTVNIPTGVTITYLRNSANTTLTILATGNVTIAGAITADGQPGSSVGFGGFGGPGAFSGGNAGVNGAAGSIADGPGAGRGGPFNSNNTCGGGGGGSYETQGGNAGTFTNGCGNTGVTGGVTGPTYGTKALLPLVGGSGGGGGCGFGQAEGGGGGGGGGAILIASSGTITFSSGIITARGGNGGGIANCGAGAGGGGGSGGAVRLIANTITGPGQILINGGSPGFGAGGGGLGFARVEAFNVSGFSLQNTVPISSGLPTSVSPTNVPTLQIASVGGVNAPASPIGSFQGAPDVVLPANQPNPVAVVVNGFNIPNGSSVNVTATSASGASTSGTATLSGTTASSTGSASVSLSTGFSVLTATTVVDLAQTGDLKPLFIDGERVDKIEVAATFGGASSLTYITHSGRRIKSLR
jgi:hypothetical protein